MGRLALAPPEIAAAPANTDRIHPVEQSPVETMIPLDDCTACLPAWRISQRAEVWLRGPMKRFHRVEALAALASLIGAFAGAVTPTLLKFWFGRAQVATLPAKQAGSPRSLGEPW